MAISSKAQGPISSDLPADGPHAYRARLELGGSDDRDTSFHPKAEATAACLRHALTELRPAVLATAFGPESMVMIDLAWRHGIDLPVLSIDTGRLPRETHALIDRTRNRYGMSVDLIHPDATELDRWTATNGPDAFYRSADLRRDCCRLRKITPLKRALHGKRAWITGLRRDQSPERADTELRTWDPGYGLFKVSPMLDWTREEVWAYLRVHQVPYNALHDKGYASIGCAPCCRPIAAGESERDGRWWWEHGQPKECGLHLDPATGQLVRGQAVDHDGGHLTGTGQGD